MVQRDDANNFRGPVIELLARAITRKINCAEDHSTAIPPPSLHRRDGPTEPMACICGLGLAVTTQGSKQVMLGDKILNQPSKTYIERCDTIIQLTKLLLRLNYS